jgi:hypothetical protein
MTVDLSHTRKEPESKALCEHLFDLTVCGRVCPRPFLACILEIITNSNREFLVLDSKVDPIFRCFTCKSLLVAKHA